MNAARLQARKRGVASGVAIDVTNDSTNDSTNDGTNAVTSMDARDDNHDNISPGSNTRGCAMPPIGRLRIGLLDDHAVVRAGYRRLIELEDDLVVAAEFADAESAYAALSRDGDCPLDLLVLDLSMPGQSGFELLGRLSMRRPALPVLVFTMHDSAAMVSQCLNAGAAGFVTKSSAPDVLLAALRSVSRGEMALSHDVAGQAAPPGGKTPAHPHAALSMREFSVLQRLLAGQGIEQIARGLHLSVKTVANYQTDIRRTLNVRNAMELLHYAQAHGIVAAADALVP